MKPVNKATNRFYSISWISESVFRKNAINPLTKWIWSTHYCLSSMKKKALKIFSYLICLFVAFFPFLSVMSILFVYETSVWLNWSTKHALPSGLPQVNKYLKHERSKPYWRNRLFKQFFRNFFFHPNLRLTYIEGDLSVWNGLELFCIINESYLGWLIGYVFYVYGARVWWF